VPERNAKLKQLLEKFARGRTSGRVRTMFPTFSSPPSKLRVQTKAADLICSPTSDMAHRDQLVDMEMSSERGLTEQYGTDIYPFCRKRFFINGHWKGLESIWAAFLANYLQSKFRRWARARQTHWGRSAPGREEAKEDRPPVGIQISHA